MAFKTILVPIDQHGLMNSTLETALVLAQSFDSYIEGFALRVAMPVDFAVVDVGAVPILPSKQEIAENEKRSRGPFENFMQEHGVPRRADTKALSSGWFENAPEGDDFVGSYGRVFDAIVLGKPGREGARMTTLEAGLFESGRPVLIAPPSPQPRMGTTVLIAWNCSTEQARTTAFAMPILKRVNRVIVLTVAGGAAVPGPTGEQLCRYLQLNEVPAKPMTVTLDSRLCTAANYVRHSITSSASASSLSGTVRPSASAVLRLTTSWYLDACSTGRSAGFGTATAATCVYSAIITLTNSRSCSNRRRSRVKELIQAFIHQALPLRGSGFRCPL